MIRREGFDQDALSHWVLISQVDHARISAELATHWGNATLAPVIAATATPLAAIRREVLAAVKHHDDGWQGWSREPDFDSSGRPRSFMEMPLDQALPIWSKSIARARAIGPLAGAIVAGHFSALLSSSDRCDQQPARQWLAERSREQSAWLGEWEAINPAWHTPQMSSLALRWLQFFDALSLWICGHAPTPAESRPPAVPYPLSLPDDNSVTIVAATGHRPARDASAPRPSLSCLQPWPFVNDTVSFQAEGDVVPIRHYRSVDELVAVRKVCHLHWLLTKQALSN